MDGWNEWSRHVLAELERLSACYESLNINFNKLTTEVAMLKVKAGVWGLVGGGIAVAIGLGIYLIKGRMQ